MFVGILATSFQAYTTGSTFPLDDEFVEALANKIVARANLDDLEEATPNQGAAFAVKAAV